MATLIESSIMSMEQKALSLLQIITTQMSQGQDILQRIYLQGVNIMAAIDDLNAKLDAMDAESKVVVQSLSDLVTHVKTLQDAVANSSAATDPAIVAATARVQSQIDNLTGAVSAATVPATP